MRSAALFQLTIVPERSLLMIASKEDSTMAARRSALCSSMPDCSAFTVTLE